MKPAAMSLCLAQLAACNALGEPIGVAPLTGDQGGSFPDPDTPAKQRDAEDAGASCPEICDRSVPLAERDTDGDGILDVYDTDDDNDGLLDIAECETDGFGRLANSGFEQPTVTDPLNFEFFDPLVVPGWSTAGEENIELWVSGHQNIESLAGMQHAELNVDGPSTLYQDFATVPGQALRWAFYHRGRETDDTLELLLGSAEALTSQGVFTTPTGAWVLYAGTYSVPNGQIATRLQFQSMNDSASANLLDEIWIEPECLLDSDGDGCVDSEDVDPRECP